MVNLGSPEYLELWKKKIIWDESCALVADNPRLRDPDYNQALLARRDAAYSAYRLEHGDPSGVELVRLHDEPFQVFMTTGGHYLLPKLYSYFDKYNLGSVILDIENRLFYPVALDSQDQLPKVSIEKWKTDMPEWKFSSTIWD